MPPFPDARRGPRSLWINAIIVDTMVTSSLVRHLPQDLFALFCLALAIVCGAQEMAHLAGQAIRHGRAPDWHRGVAPPVNVNGASSSARAEAVAAEMRHGEAGAALEQRLFGGQMHVRYRTLGEWEEMSLESADGIELHVRQGSSVRRYDVGAFCAYSVTRRLPPRRHALPPLDRGDALSLHVAAAIARARRPVAIPRPRVGDSARAHRARVAQSARDGAGVWLAL